MPLYDYRCQSCGAEEEHLQKFSDPPIAQCSSCSGPLEKLISGAAFHLKGGGWYKDGYASTKPAAEGGSGGGAAKTDGKADAPKPKPSGDSGSKGSGAKAANE